MNLDDIVSLATAAEELGLSPDTLKRQAQIGRIDARNVGKTWITTRQEVERYRSENLGRRGRPKGTFRRTDSDTGWAVVYVIDDSVEEVKVIDAKGVVAMALDGQTSGEAIVLRLNIEAVAQHLVADVESVDHDRKVVRARIRRARHRPWSEVRRAKGAPDGP